METNDLKKITDKAFNFYEQLSDKILKDVIDNDLGTEEILGAATLLFLDTVWCSRLSLDGVDDYNSQYAKNKREELAKKLNKFLNEFLSENKEYTDESIQEDSRAKSSK